MVQWPDQEMGDKKKKPQTKFQLFHLITCPPPDKRDFSELHHPHNHIQRTHTLTHPFKPPPATEPQPSLTLHNKQ